MGNNSFKTNFSMRKSLSMLFKNKTSLLSHLVDYKEGDLTFRFPTPVIKRGKGQFIYDYDGNRYIDLYLSGGDLILGHSHPQLTKIIKGWLGRGYGAGYPQVGLEMLAKKLENTFLLNNEDGLSADRKWFFFPSYESMQVSLMNLIGYFAKEVDIFYYFFSSQPKSTQAEQSTKYDIYNRAKADYPLFNLYCPQKNIVQIDLNRLSIGSPEFSKSEFSKIEKIKKSICLFEIHPFFDVNLQLEILELLKKQQNLLISLEKEFCSFLFTVGNQAISNLFDGRCFGNWISSGLPLTALFFKDFSHFQSSTINVDYIIENLGNYLWIPPLYLIKGVIRVTYLINKLGGLNEYLKKQSLFFSFLEPEYFVFNSGCISIKSSNSISKNWKDLYISLLRNGVYVSPQKNPPLYVSLVHEDEALKKYAKKINLTFRMNSR